MLESRSGALLAALLIGLLIGVERGWQSRGEESGHRVAGVRTFALFGLLGGIAGLLGGTGWRTAGAVLLLGCAATIGAGYWRKSEVADRMSATSAVAALLTLGLGALATSGMMVEAVASGCVATLLLASRSQIHGWLKGLSETDVQAGARFALIAAAIWPLLPGGAYGPYGAWNPRTLWGVVVLVTGFSFAGYVANKRFGEGRGTLATAALGGLYSSTAVIAALANRLRGSPEAARMIAAGIAIASAVMFGRVLVLTAILAPSAWSSLALLIAPAGLIAVGWALWAMRRAAGEQAAAAPEDGQRNPVELLPALGFALLVAVMAVATRWAGQRFGGAGAGAVIVVTGSFDVDAAIVTLGGLPPATFSARDAGLVLAGPVLVNTLFKALVVLASGGRTRWRAAAPLLASGFALALAIALGVLL